MGHPPAKLVTIGCGSQCLVTIKVQAVCFLLQWRQQAHARVSFYCGRLTSSEATCLNALGVILQIGLELISSDKQSEYHCTAYIRLDLGHLEHWCHRGGML
jgi:hypothetical protein